MIRYYIRHIEWFALSMSLLLGLVGLGMTVVGILVPGALGLTIVGLFTSVMMTVMYFSIAHPMTMSAARRERNSDLQNEWRLKKQQRQMEERQEKIERLVMVEGYSFEEAEKRLW